MSASRVNPTRLDLRYLGEWPDHGFTVDKFRDLDPEGTLTEPGKKQLNLLANVPHVTRMLRAGFPADRIGELHPDVPLPMYAEAWDHKIDPSIINQAHTQGSVRPENLKSSTGIELSGPKKAEIEDRHKIRPTVRDSYKGIVPGNLGHYVSGLIAGIKPEEMLQVHNHLVSDGYGVPKQLEGEHKDETSYQVPLKDYVDFRKNGGSHQDFLNLYGGIRQIHAKQGIKPSERVSSLKDVLSSYNKYTELGLNKQQATKAIGEFTKGTRPLMVVGDENFKKSISNGATPDEYWEANTKGLDMGNYAKLRETMSHQQALKKSPGSLSNLFL